MPREEVSFGVRQILSAHNSRYSAKSLSTTRPSEPCKARQPGCTQFYSTRRSFQKPPRPVEAWAYRLRQSGPWTTFHFLMMLSASLSTSTDPNLERCKTTPAGPRTRPRAIVCVPHQPGAVDLLERIQSQSHSTLPLRNSGVGHISLAPSKS